MNSNAAVLEDDLVTLGEFVEFWWASEVPWEGLFEPGDRYDAFIHRKQSAVRMLRQGREGFPTPAGHRGRAQLFRLGDLMTWGPLKAIAEAKAQREGLPVPTTSERLAGASPQWILDRAWRGCAKWMVPSTAEHQLRHLCLALTLVLHVLRTSQTAEARQMYDEITDQGSSIFEIIERCALLLETSEPELGRALRILVNAQDREQLEQHPRDQDRLVAALDGVLADRFSPGQLVELLLCHFEIPLRGDGGSRATPLGLSRLIIAMVDPQPDDLVLDPACGEGGLLLAVAKATGGGATLVGVERDPLAWAVATLRLALWGVPADITLGTYPEEGPGPIKADLVLVDTPMGSRKQYLTWLERAEDALSGEGRAAVTLPSLTLDTERREWDAVGRRSVSVVVKTPSNTRSDTSEALAVWLLDRDPSDDILRIDASGLGRKRGSLTTFSADEAELVGQTVQLWRRGAPLTDEMPTEVIRREGLGRPRQPELPQRRSSGSQGYKDIVLGLVFLKYLSDAFDERRRWLQKATDDPSNADFYVVDPDRRREIIGSRAEYAADNVFWVPVEARWDYLKDRTKQPDIGAAIATAITLLGAENPQLKGVMPDSFAHTELDQHLLGELVDALGSVDVIEANQSIEDVFGHTYGFFLERFASTEGKAGGEYYTPRSVVRLLVEMLEPSRGLVYDPCCGSGSTLVEAAEFVASHGGGREDISIYGQERTAEYWRLAKMNLAIRGIEANLGDRPDDSIHRDLHPDLQADFVFARPPFNQNTDALQSDPRWRYGQPSAGSGNYAWIQHVLHHLAPGGVAGLVMASGSLFSKSRGEGEIRKNLVEAGVVDCIVALPDKLFFDTAIPACMWLLTPNRSSSGFRERTEEVLFLDARKLGHMETRMLRTLNNQDIAKIAGTYHSWRSKDPRVPYEDVPGYCKAASLEEVATHDFVLTPGWYVGVTEDEDDPALNGVEDVEADLRSAIENALKMANANESTLRRHRVGT